MPTATPPAPVPSDPLILDVGHLVLHVTDLKAALVFYRDLLGFRVQDEEHLACCGRVRIGTGGSDLVLLQVEEFTPLGLGPAGLGTPLHLRVANFGRAASFLESRGVRVHREDEHAGTVFDPSGNAIGLYDRTEGAGPTGHPPGPRRRRPR